MSENRKTVLEVLEKLGISYQLFEHDAAYTMEACEQIDTQLGIAAEHCKNLFLCNRQGTSYYLLLIQGEKLFKTADVSKQLGISRLSFGKEDKLLEYLGTIPGAVTPLGLIFDKNDDVMLVMDRDVASSENICLHPCENTSSVVISTRDFMEKFLPYTKHKPAFVTIPSHYEEK